MYFPAGFCGDVYRAGQDRVSVVVFPVRNPVQRAKSVSTLDHLSNGRVTPGIGLGPPAAAENFYRRCGTHYRERVRRFTEGVAVMRSLWADERAPSPHDAYVKLTRVPQLINVRFSAQHNNYQKSGVTRGCN